MLAAVLRWAILRMEQIRGLRLRLLASAARITLSAAILSAMLVGEPTAPVRTAMAAQPAPRWPGFGLGFLARPTETRPIIVLWTPTPRPTAAWTPTPQPSPTATATPAPTPTQARLPAAAPPNWIEAPAIGLSAPVVETGWVISSLDGSDTAEWQVPDGAAGFHKGTAYPGHPGNTVISGHHNIGGEVFRHLIELNVGDEVILYVDKLPYRYTVQQKEIVLEQGVSEDVHRANARWIAATDDERVTLVTCWPYTGNSHRLIIVAKPKTP